MAAENYAGKVVKVKCLCNGILCEETGVVLSYRANEGNNWVSIQLMRTNGLEWDYSGRLDNIIKITSTRIDKELRTALGSYFNAVRAEKEFIEKMKQEQARYRKEKSDTLAAIRNISGTLGYTEFRDALERLFNEKIPQCNRPYERRYIELESIGEKTVTLYHMQEVRKYPKPEEFPFLSRRYDDTLELNRSHRGFKEFCERYAPALIPSLAAHSKVATNAALSEKHLMACREYTFPLKHGMTRKSLEYIESLF